MHFPDMHHAEHYHGRSLLLITYGWHQNVGNLGCRGLKEFEELNLLANRNLSTFTCHQWKRWWIEREKHSEGGGRTRQVGSFEPKKNIFRMTPGLKGRRNRWCQAYEKDNDQVWKLFKDGGALDQASLEKKDTAAFIQRVKKLGLEVSYMH
jgi:hypothetical protein